MRAGNPGNQPRPVEAGSTREASARSGVLTGMLLALLALIAAGWVLVGATIAAIGAHALLSGKPVSVEGRPETDLGSKFCALAAGLAIAGLGVGYLAYYLRRHARRESMRRIQRTGTFNRTPPDEPVEGD